MSFKILLPKDEHRGAVFDLLNSPSFRVQILCHHVYDTPVERGLMLSRLLQRLLSTRRRLVLVIGQHPSEVQPARTRLEVIAFLKDLVERGARVYLKRGLHAKLLRAEGDTIRVIITSANLSRTALHQNDELGVYMSDASMEGEKVRQFIHYVMSQHPIPLEEVLAEIEGG